MARTGRIHSFESFGTLDGPGIRFIVFMQGCPLRCIYCHNRDTWDPAGGKEYTTHEVMSEIRKYLNYFRFSHGGVTLSGGEPTLQPDFAEELFYKCKAEGIHTALDTSGYIDVPRAAGLLEYTDLILLDIKQADFSKHKEITGVTPEKICSFARFASEKGIPMWIRYVLVPGLTDTESDLSSAAQFIGSLKTVENIEVLPYHTMGAHKWTALGEAYQLPEVEPPSEESIEKARGILYRRL